MFDSNSKESDKNLKMVEKGKTVENKKLRMRINKTENVLITKSRSYKGSNLNPRNLSNHITKKTRDCPRFKDGIPCMKFLLKGYGHTECNHLHDLLNDQLKEFKRFINNIRESIKEQDF
jgi:hypothetical protein